MNRVWLHVLPLVLGGALAAQERPKDDPNPLTETQRIQHALSRFSFGPTPGLVDEVRRRGLAEWFEAQLEAGSGQGNEYLAERLGELPSIAMNATEIVKSYNRRLPPNPTPKQRRDYNRRRNLPRQELKDAVLFRAIYGRNQVLEVASDFWRNHFNVTVNKANVRFYATEYENEVIRGGALGRFGAMLEKSAKHPAMLVYLDNAVSRRPPSKQELRAIERTVRRRTKSRERAEERVEIAKQRGLNENYARELLELHTLGVDNYYRQKDVVEVAKALTGWTVQNDPKKTIQFLFRPDMHLKGDRVFLGQKLRDERKSPLRLGERILAKLVRHKGTARFLAWKLCRHLVQDQPADGMVKRVAAAYQRSRGDLKEVYRAIFHDRDFFKKEHYQAKFKRPFEFVVSALRVTGAEVRQTRALHGYLRQLSEPLYECEDPTGYYDQAEAWNDPGVMAVRWKFAMDLVQGKIHGIRIPASFYQGLHPKIPLAWKDQLAERVLAAGLSEKTGEALDRQIRDYLDDNPGRMARRRLPALILGMLLGSPEFQRQ